ncbi:hypothetical protein AAMO2058_001116200 [Amorphochlora amoebiformis]
MKASALVEKRDRDIKEGIHFRNEQIKTVGIIASMAGEAKSKHKVYPYAPGSKVLVAKYPLQRTELEKGELDGSDMVMRMEDPEILEKRLAEIEPQMWQDHHEAVKTNLQEAMRDYRKSKGMADAREKTELDIKKLTNHVLRLEEAEREARAKILRMKRKESDGPEGDIDHNYPTTLPGIGTPSAHNPNAMFKPTSRFRTINHDIRMFHAPCYALCHEARWDTEIQRLILDESKEAVRE